MCTNKFIDIMNRDNQFNIVYEVLNDEKYIRPCLELDSNRYFPGLIELTFYMYIFIKKWSFL